MKIQCPDCKAALTIPDHKIPQDGSPAKRGFKCPKCGGKFSAFPRPEPGSTDPVSQTEAPVPSGDAPAEPVPETSALVMVGDVERQEQCRAALAQLGYGSKIVDSMVEATFLTEYQSFPVVVVDDTFDNGKGLIPFVDFVNHMDVSRRRQICLIMISGDKATGDPMEAMRNNVNFVFGEEGLGRLTAVLADALKGYEELYRVYNKAWDKLEKA